MYKFIYSYFVCNFMTNLNHLAICVTTIVRLGTYITFILIFMKSIILNRIERYYQDFASI